MKGSSAPDRVPPAMWPLALGLLAILLASYFRRRVRGGGARSLFRTIDGEGALQEMVHRIGSRLERQGVDDEDQLGAAITEAKRSAYKRRYSPEVHTGV